MRVLELFAGIGACSSALDRLGIEHDIVDAVEIDKYAIQSFNAIHGTSFGVQDVCTWDKDLEVDLICGGFPCQDISIAGKQAGIVKGETRSGLMFEMMRIIKKLSPNYVITENVKNILSDKHIPQLLNYIGFLHDNNYMTQVSTLNAKDFGIPQNRERVFIIAWKKGLDIFFSQPIPHIRECELKDFINYNEIVPKEYYYEYGKYNDNMCKLLKEKVDDESSVYQWRRCYVRKNQSNLVPTLTANMGEGGHNVPIIKTKNGIRKLTPRECWRLMGFTDEEFDKAQSVGISNTQLYKQARKLYRCKCFRRDI